MYTVDSTEVIAFVAAYQRVKGWNYPLSTSKRGSQAGTLSNLTSAYQYSMRMKVCP